MDALTTLQLLLSVFGVIFVAELPDKTALSALVLATHYPPGPVFAGTALALTVQSAIAVSAGRLLAALPISVVRYAAGALFVISGILMVLRRGTAEGLAPAHPETRAEPTAWRVFRTVFVVVFVAEWGDLTQLGTAALAARFQAPLVVFCGATLALWAVAALAVLAGNRLATVLRPEHARNAAAVAFVIIGILLLVGVI